MDFLQVFNIAAHLKCNPDYWYITKYSSKLGTYHSLTILVIKNMKHGLNKYWFLVRK